MSRLSDVPKKVLYNPNTSLGEAEPYVFVHRTKGSIYTDYFHVSEHEIFQLEGGQGVIVGRQEYGPWFMLQIFRWSVVSLWQPKTDKELKRLKELKEYLFDG